MQERGRKMTLNQLDKNSRFGYRRGCWLRRNSYIAFINSVWVYVNPKGTAMELDTDNLEANDWYLSDIPNKFYKRVAIITIGNLPNFPKGTRIIQCTNWTQTNNQWIKADYSSNRTIFKTPGIDCEWETCEDPRQKRKFKAGDTIKYKNSFASIITSIEHDRYRLDDNTYILFADEDKWELQGAAQVTVDDFIGYRSITTGEYFPSLKSKESENTSCSNKPTTQPTQKETKMEKLDLRLLLAMMAGMSEEETKDATNSKHAVIVTKDDEYEGYFYADTLEEVEEIVAQPSNELKKFHVFDYGTTLAQKPRKVVSVKRL